MKTRTISESHRTDLKEFTSTYREVPGGVELCGVSFGFEPIGYASPEDISAHYREGSGLCWIECAARVVLNTGTVKRF